MANLKFQIRGTQKPAWFASAWQDYAVTQGADSSMPVVSSGTSGVFGGSLIDMRAALPMIYTGLDNWCPGTQGFTLLMRIVPTWTGNPSTAEDLFYAGAANTTLPACSGVKLTLQNYGATILAIRDLNGTAIYNDQFYGSFPPFENGVPIDLWVAWDGTSNPIELWAANAGNAPTKLCSNNPYTTALANRIRAAVPAFTVGREDVNDSGATDYFLNELCVWDGYVSPSSFGARTGFISAPNTEGYALASDYTDPGVANVLEGVSYEFAGESETGTLTSTDPGVENVNAGVEYEINSVSKTGTRQTVTNVLASATLVAGKSSAVLKGGIE